MTDEKQAGPPSSDDGPVLHSEDGRIYGRRHGRPLRRSQERLLDDVLPRVAIPPGQEPLDPAALFAHKPREIWLEIGFGGGEHLAAQATRNPDIGLIGCEPFLNGVVSALGHIGSGNLENVRVWPNDVRLLLARLPERCLGRVFALFPDPWPKKRHNKRRIVQRANLDRLAPLMLPGAELRLATDDLDYLDWMLAETAPHPAFEWLARRPADWRERPEDWPPTRYEQKARRRGVVPYFLRFRRRAGGDG
jgi:tRNA (guanine-N7-)-methyltransferase